MTDTEVAWDAIHDATPLGWFVGRPAFEPHRELPWSQYAFDPTEKSRIGHRSREWTAVGVTELECLEEMARCLAEIREGNIPG